MTPSLLLAAGTTAAAALAAIGLAFPGYDAPRFFVLAGVAAVAYAVAMLAIARGVRLSRAGLAAALVLAAVSRVGLLAAPPAMHGDVARYLFDARLQRAGIVPYTVSADDPSVAHLHTAETRHVIYPHLPTIYPPTAQLFFRLATVPGETALAFKSVLVACDAAIVALLLVWLRRTGRPATLVLAYAWHPVVALEGAGAGHLDVAGALWLAAAFVAFSRGARAWAMAWLGVAVATKFLALVVLPLLWRRVRVRDGLVFAAVMAAVYAPFLEAGPQIFGSLGAFVDRFRFNDFGFSLLAVAAGPREAAAVAVAAGLATAALLWRRADDPGAWAWPMAATLFFAPVVYPWYLLWTVPFLLTPLALPVAAWTIGMIATYATRLAGVSGAAGTMPWWIPALEFGPVIVAALWLATRRPHQEAA